jgi:hypothetical protein
MLRGKKGGDPAREPFSLIVKLKSNLRLNIMEIIKAVSDLTTVLFLVAIVMAPQAIGTYFASKRSK